MTEIDRSELPSGPADFEGTTRNPEPVAPNTKNVDHTIAAEIDIPDHGAAGVLASCGGASAGWTLFVHDGKLVWEHNWFGDDRYRVTSDEPLPAGHHIVSADIRVDDPTLPGTGGTVTLRVGETEVGTGRFDMQVPFRFTVNETLDIGCDTITPVSDLYGSPARFTGTLHRVLIDVTGQSFVDLATMVRIALATQRHHAGDGYVWSLLKRRRSRVWWYSRGMAAASSSILARSTRPGL